MFWWKRDQNILISALCKRSQKEEQGDEKRATLNLFFFFRSSSANILSRNENTRVSNQSIHDEAKGKRVVRMYHIFEHFVCSNFIILECFFYVVVLTKMFLLQEKYVR